MNTKLSPDQMNRLNSDEFKKAGKQPVTVVLENIRSGHNVGAVFRTCDAFRIEGVILIGYTPQPPHREILKTALGATQSVSWQHFEDSKSALAYLTQKRTTVIACEQTKNSTQLWNIKSKLLETPLALVFGNEVKGVSEEVVQASQICLEIPQSGTKHSLNVSVSAGVVLWHFTQLRQSAQDGNTKGQNR